MVGNDGERKEPKERERLLQQLLDALLEYCPGGIAIAAAGDDKIRMVSKYSEQRLGWLRKALEGLALSGEQVAHFAAGVPVRKGLGRMFQRGAGTRMSRIILLHREEHCFAYRT